MPEAAGDGWLRAAAPRGERHCWAHEMRWRRTSAALGAQMSVLARGVIASAARDPSLYGWRTGRAATHATDSPWAASASLLVLWRVQCARHAQTPPGVGHGSGLVPTTYRDDEGGLTRQCHALAGSTGRERTRFGCAVLRRYRWHSTVPYSHQMILFSFFSFFSFLFSFIRRGHTKDPPSQTGVLIRRTGPPFVRPSLSVLL